MTEHDARNHSRSPAARLTQVTVYRDRAGISRVAARRHVTEGSGPYAIFNIVGFVRDVSRDGLGMSFEGQQLMAHNVLRPDERYLLKLTLAMERIPRDLVPLLIKDGDFHALLLSALCRWYRFEAPLSKAGFGFAESTAPEILRFLVDIL